MNIKRRKNRRPDKSKRHLYKTAKVKGLNRCYVGIVKYLGCRDYNWKESYLCRTPFGTERIYSEDDLENFCL